MFLVSTSVESVVLLERVSVVEVLSVVVVVDLSVDERLGEIDT